MPNLYAALLPRLLPDEPEHLCRLRRHLSVVAEVAPSTSPPWKSVQECLVVILVKQGGEARHNLPFSPTSPPSTRLPHGVHRLAHLRDRSARL